MPDPTWQSEDGMTLGPPRYYRPVCIRVGSLGFIGGPSGYVEVSESERDSGPVIVEAKETQT